MKANRRCRSVTKLKFKIDREFVQRWAPVYDQMEHDEDEYRSVLWAVRKQLDEDGGVSQDLFKEIIRCAGFDSR